MEVNKYFGDSGFFQIVDEKEQYCKVEFTQNLNDPYILFRPRILADLLGSEDSELPVRATAYLARHPEIERMPERPRSYMVAEFNCFHVSPLLHPIFADTGVCEECKDINLLLQVFGSTVGRLYIPDRKLAYPASRFQATLLFRAREVYGHD